MAKKKMKIAPLMSALATLLGLVAVIMLFVPVLGVKDVDTTYTGLKVVFGYKEKVAIIGDVTVFNFSFMNLLTYILALAGTVLSLLNLLAKKPNKLFSLLAMVAFVVSAVFFFCTVSFTSVNEDASKIFDLFGGDIKELFKLGVGAIVGGVLSILAALASAASPVLKK